MIGALSDIGNLRKVNEDFLGYYKDDYKKIYIMADGMGGHNAGEVASKLAVNSSLDFIKACSEINNPREILTKAIMHSNKEIYNLSCSDASLVGMGTTMTACLIVGKTLLVANIGDSCCYVINNIGITKITKDHSLVQELIDDGSITEAEARYHPNKNVVTRALGTSSNVDIDIYELSVENIFKIILCTDGLTNEVNAEEIHEFILKWKNNKEACEKLVELAKERKGRDNISVMIFEGVSDDDRDHT